MFVRFFSSIIYICCLQMSFKFPVFTATHLTQVKLINNILKRNQRYKNYLAVKTTHYSNGICLYNSYKVLCRQILNQLVKPKYTNEIHI